MNKHLRQLIIASSLALGILILILSINYLILGTLERKQIINIALITFSYAYPLHFVSAYGFYIAKKIGHKNNLNQWQSAIAGFPFVIILNVVMIRMVQFVMANYIFDNAQFFGDTFWEQIKIPLWISLTIGISFYIFHFINAYQKAKMKRQKEQVVQITQSHEALKSQIGPHFLFNSLNVLSGLVDENPIKAQDFIADLAQVYRYVLDQKDKNWVQLSEEISFADNYLDLIKTRFENSLDINIQEELANSEAFIAPLTLQLLLENCIKHNALSANEPLKISIYEENGFLIVKNSLNFKRTLSERKGTGLENIRNRYASVGENVIIDKTPSDFIVKIPLLDTNIIKMNTQYNFTESEMRMAREQVRERVGYFGNLIAYVTVCSILLLINLQIGGYVWAIWPIIGWGIGILFHGLSVFVFGKKNLKTNSWEDEQARKLLEKRKRMNSSNF